MLDAVGCVNWLDLPTLIPNCIIPTLISQRRILSSSSLSQGPRVRCCKGYVSWLSLLILDPRCIKGYDGLAYNEVEIGYCAIYLCVSSLDVEPQLCDRHLVYSVL